MKSYFAVEYSPSSKCYHTQEVEGMVQDNIRVWSSQVGSDYICLGIFPTHELATKFYRALVNSSGSMEHLREEYK